MITPEQTANIHRRAYVPEHVLNLMVGVSQAEPQMVEDYLFFTREDWLIFIGYPLERPFRKEDLAAALDETLRKFRPGQAWFIAPEIPDPFLRKVRQRESDIYYKWEPQSATVPQALRRAAAKAAKEMTLSRSREFSPEHERLTADFVTRAPLPPRVRELFLRMGAYVTSSPTSLILNAWDKQGRLAAYTIIELAADAFAVYVVGCFSKNNYVAHASDLLFSEMINLARETGKVYIHLGLGVNDGIRRFKKKWGGIPFLPYEFGEISGGLKGPLAWIRALDFRR